MEDGIELFGQPRVEVVTRALRLGQINHADRSLEARLAKRAGLAQVPQHEEKCGSAGLVKQLFVATWECRANAFALGGSAPVGGRGDRTVIGAEANQPSFSRMPLAGELTNIELARLAHLSGACVTDVRVMSPECVSRRFHDETRPRNIAR